ncbi:MAG: replication-associated recombination protein A [Clostridia bacterium]|nr:replication-associated recombination protein A [Clostridia bacterium]
MSYRPLADRIRPESLDEMVGQEHLIGQNGILRRMLEKGRIGNMIFAGPPGTGKTTAAGIIAKATDLHLCRLNATTATLADVKAVITETANMFGAGGLLLYLDEIQYFNKKQQQSLLEYMEDGRVTLIASTTENPYFAIYPAILSRSSVFEFRPVEPEACVPLLRRALRHLNEENETSKTADDELLSLVAAHAGGDVRNAVGLLENGYYLANDVITREDFAELFPSYAGAFSSTGDGHYDLMSCLQKSIRGSDPDATVFYLAKILAAGDLLAAIRRLQVIASEDVGAAYPMAAVIVRACTESARELGLPEAAIPLANAAIILATAPKSNTTYLAYHAARADVDAGRGQIVPEHLRSPLFRGYLYPHDYPDHYVEQTYLPEDLLGKRYYTFGDNKTEQAAKSYYEKIRKHF